MVSFPLKAEDQKSTARALVGAYYFDGWSGQTNHITELLKTEFADRQAVWQQLGHAIDWCDSETAWKELFRSEARPHWQTFYWEAVARMMSEYLAAHPAASPEAALSDCLIATQCPPCADDPAALQEFHATWQRILSGSTETIDASMQRDLELAEQEGTHETVAALYAADRQAWKKR